MTPDPALWNCRSRGFKSGGASKNRRKNGSSRSGLRPGCSLIVPRVAMFTTEGETRLTMGASVGMGAASAAGTAANACPQIMDAASAAAAKLRRRFKREVSSLPARKARPDLKSGLLASVEAILHGRTRAKDPLRRLRPGSYAVALGPAWGWRLPAHHWRPSP